MTDVTTPRGASLTDVATLAGVSHQTVSRVVNRHPNVSDATRRKVRAAIVELDYRPNAAARWLATGRTHSIGILAGELGQYGPSNVLMGIQDAARTAGYFLTVVTLKDYSEATVNEGLHGLLNHGVEGIIAITPHVSALKTLATIRTNVPLVTAGGGHSLAGDVSLDQERGAMDAVHHLIDLGHRRIAYLAGPFDWVDSQRRLNGWRTGLRERGLQEGGLYEGDWSARSGYNIGMSLDLEDGPTAVCVGNDEMALGLLKAMRERGCNVPRDMSITGFDDAPGAAFFEPSLTTVRQEFQEMGRLCIETLIGSHPEQPDAATITTPQLVIRASTHPVSPQR
jgi:DNA-binding LacI/PurR family transcriptional regulator